MKVIDIDGDDALNADATPVAKPAEYWWNATDDNCWQSNIFAGFLKVGDGNVGISPAKSVTSIFGQTSSYQIQLNRTANVSVYNALGQQMKSLKNVNKVDLSNLRSGVYIIRANNEVKKFFR
jgi:hypothetical protein